jgi:hypothetical protein
MSSSCVLDLELSFWILDQAAENLTPNVMHAPVVDFMSGRLAYEASIDTVIRGSRSALSLSGMSRTDFREGNEAVEFALIFSRGACNMPLQISYCCCKAWMCTVACLR